MQVVQFTGQVIHMLLTVLRNFPAVHAHRFGVAVFTTKLLTQERQSPVRSLQVGQRALQAWQTPLVVAVMNWLMLHLQALLAVSAVKVALQALHIPVLNEQVAQLEGHARQLLLPSLYFPAGQVIMSSHNLVVGFNHWMVGSGLHAH